MQVSTFPLLSFLHLHSLFTSFLSSAHIKAGNSPLSFFFSSFLPSFFPSFLSAMEYFSRVPLILLLQYKNTEWVLVSTAAHTYPHVIYISESREMRCRNDARGVKMSKSKAPFPCARLFHPIMIAMVCGCHRNKAPPPPSPPPVFDGIRLLVTDLDRTARLRCFHLLRYQTGEVLLHRDGRGVELLNGSTSSGVFIRIFRAGNIISFCANVQ